MKKATREDTKAHNYELVRKTIYHHGEISRADVARLTGLTRTTVSDVIGDLIGDGLVAEVGVGPSIGGKPPILLRVVDDSRWLVGVDLADSEFRGALINLRGSVRCRVSVPVGDRDGEAALTLLYEVIESLLAKAERPIAGIGIGTPGLMDPHRRVVRQAVNLNWRELPLGDLLEGRFGPHVYIANDSQVAAMAERIFGSGRGASNLVVIKVARGIGAGIVLDGQIYYGDGFGAGEIGHVAVVEDGEQCRCGHFGCLETVASCRAIEEQAREAARRDKGSIYHTLTDSPDGIELDTVVRAFEAGDEATRRIVARAAFYLGVGVANLVGALNVERIVIAGPITRFGPALLEPIREQVARRSLEPLASRTIVSLSDLGPDIVSLGAAALLLSSALGLV
jgi:glucokinase-like ROK family protein